MNHNPWTLGVTCVAVVVIVVAGGLFVQNLVTR